MPWVVVDFDFLRVHTHICTHFTYFYVSIRKIWYAHFVETHVNRIHVHACLVKWGSWLQSSAAWGKSFTAQYGVSTFIGTDIMNHVRIKFQLLATIYSSKFLPFLAT